MQAFAKPKGALQAHTGVVQGGTKGQLSLAMPADRSGYWLTKASAIKESGVLQLVLPGKKARPVRLVGSDNVNDVALLQVNGTDG